MTSMFGGARAFNQNLNSWNVSKVTNFSSMFLGSTTFSLTTSFNNGETGLATIPNVTPANASYANSTKTLTCTGAQFLTDLTTNDVLIIQTSTLIYSSKIQSITNNTTLILETAYGFNITLGTITTLQKQVVGTSPLNWTFSTDPTVTINMSAMFRYCIYFNQNIGGWNTSRVTNVSNMFAGDSTAEITLFNNGEIITGTTAKMGDPTGWTFDSVPTSTGYRTNCRLTSTGGPSGTGNRPASLS
jgi:surface protein